MRRLVEHVCMRRREDRRRFAAAGRDDAALPRTRKSGGDQLHGFVRRAMRHAAEAHVHRRRTCVEKGSERWSWRPVRFGIKKPVARDVASRDRIL